MKSPTEMSTDIERLRELRRGLLQYVPQSVIAEMATDFRAELLEMISRSGEQATVAKLKGIDPELIDRMQLLGLRVLLREVLLLRCDATIHRINQLMEMTSSDDPE